MSNGMIIMDEREKGKTTYLFNLIKKFLEVGSNEKIFVMDSVTEHPQKSLLKKVENEFPDKVKVVDLRDYKKIVIGNIPFEEYSKDYKKYFPYKDIIGDDKIVCFDLSFFLEKAYELYEKTEDKEIFRKCRRLYNLCAQQILLSIILHSKEKNDEKFLTFMDEIEFPIVDYDFYNETNNMTFFASVHPENAFGSFYEFFKKGRLNNYRYEVEAQSEAEAKARTVKEIGIIKKTIK